MPEMNTGRLLQIRKKRSCTQAEVALACGITQSFYAKLEQREAAPSPETAARLATYFGHEITEMQLLYPERYEVAVEA